VRCAEAAAAVVLANASGTAARARLLGGLVFFEPDAGRVASRLAPFIRDLSDEGDDLPSLVLATPAYDGAFERTPLARAGLQALDLVPAPRVELFAAAGPRAVVELVRSGRAGTYVVIVRDPEGPVAAVAVEVAGVTPRTA